MIAIILTSFILFTLGMGLLGLAFLSFLQDALRYAELTDGP